MRSNIIIAAGLILFIAIVGTRRPLRMKAEEKVTARGIVTEMYQTTFRDFVVKLKDRAEIYYIDGQLTNGFSFSELKSRVMYKPVVIHYPDRWNPLREEEKKLFISRLEYNGQILFDDTE